MFQLNHDSSKFDVAEVTFKRHANAWLIVAVDPVLNESMKNIACGAYEAVADIDESSPAKMEATRGELRALRDNLRMVRYVLKTDFPAAFEHVKHYLTRTR